MSRRQDLLEDPVVEEIRAIRRRMQEEAGGTLEGLLKLINDRAAARGAALKAARKTVRSSKTPAPKARTAATRRR